MRRAITRNPTAAVAVDEIRRAEALVAQARAAALPSLTGNGTYTRLDADRVLGTRVIAAAGQKSANVSLAVPLVAPQPWLRWSHAGDNVDVATWTAADVRRQVAIATGRAYLGVLAQARSADANRRALDVARAHHARAHERFAGGVGNHLDEVRAEQEAATDEAQLAAAETALARAREALGVLVGAEGPVDTADDPPAGEPSALDASLDDAERRRADVRAARAKADAATRVVRDGWADYLPLLTGTFQPFYQDPPSLVTPKTGWQAQLVLSVPLFDGGVRIGQHREQAVAEAEAKAQLEAALRQARSDVRVAFEAVRHADDALASARRAAGLAREALDLAELAYKAGATTNIEVIDAERRARDADTAAAAAEDVARQARLELLAAAGRFP